MKVRNQKIRVGVGKESDPTGGRRRWRLDTGQR